MLKEELAHDDGVFDQQSGSQFRGRDADGLSRVGAEAPNHLAWAMAGHDSEGRPTEPHTDVPPMKTTDVTDAAAAVAR